jgi:hypothetical protein
MRLLFWITACIISLAAAAQAQSYRATMRGGGGDGGKCTFEVEVDGVAEVSFSGDTGQLRTISGHRANWRRLECTGPMPRNPYDFRFRGIDGRGRQDLVRDPSRNGGMAVVRIEDSQGGREGYTFDLQWRGGGGGGGWGGGGGGGGGWGGGWNNGWGDVITYRGQGRGDYYRQGGQQQRIYGVDVSIDRRANRVNVRMDTNRGNDALVFNGRIQRVSGNTVYADVRNGANRGDYAGASGIMAIDIGGNRRVRSMNMDGQVAGGRFTVRWND